MIPTKLYTCRDCGKDYPDCGIEFCKTCGLYICEYCLIETWEGCFCDACWKKRELEKKSWPKCAGCNEPDSIPVRVAGGAFLCGTCSAVQEQKEASLLKELEEVK